MINPDLSIRETKYQQSLSTTASTIIVTSLLSGGLSAVYQNEHTFPQLNAPIEYIKEHDTLGSTALIDIYQPSEESIVMGLINIHESLLTEQERLDSDLHTLLYENIDDLYA